jgi:predicted NBD/HSP70 family sugar kinase
MGKKININSVKNQNRQLVLKEILNNEHITRTEIAHKLRLSNATVGTLADELIKMDIACEEKDQSSSVGRRPSLLRLKSKSKQILVMDLTSRDMSYTILNLDITISDSKEFEYNNQLSYKENLVIFLEDVLSYVNNNNIIDKLIGIGVSIPGTYDNIKDSVLCNLIPELNDIQLKALISQYFPQNIFIDNDMTLAGIASIQTIENVRKKSVFFISLGRGIGGAISINGNIYKGGNGFAGEIGQTMLTPKNTLEELVSWNVFISNVKKKYKLTDDTNIKYFVLEKYLADDPIIIEELESVATYIAQAFVNIVWLVNPNTIIISGRYNIFGKKFIALLREKISHFVFPQIFESLEIVLSSNKDKNSVLGVGYLIRQYWINHLTYKVEE